MQKQFEGKTCVLCQVRASSPTGEHVWPLWLLKAFPPGKGYAWWINGKQLLSGDGMAVALWFRKTLLLLAHPAARESDPDVTPARWDSVSDDLYSWMVTNQ